MYTPIRRRLLITHDIINPRNKQLGYVRTALSRSRRLRSGHGPPGLFRRTRGRTDGRTLPEEQLLGGHLEVEDGDALVVHDAQRGARLHQRHAQVHVTLHVGQEQRCRHETHRGAQSAGVRAGESQVKWNVR